MASRFPAEVPVVVSGENRPVADDKLRILAVHAHPDDEASKGSATVARYVREGVEVLVATCTGGERGSILNPAMVGPDVIANLAGIRHQEMERAIAILGAHHAWLGFVEPGLPEGAPLPPRPEGGFALEPLELAAEPLVRLVGTFRRVTTQVQCADFFDGRDRALIAHETQVDPESFWFVCPLEFQQRAWPTEDYELARSLVDTTVPEDDLFAGIRERVTR